MRKLLFCFIFAASCLIAASLCLAAGDTRDHPSCPLCGMHRQTYAHSRMLFQYDDGSSLGTCSIHCAAMELALNRHKTVRALYAADRTGKKLELYYHGPINGNTIVHPDHDEHRGNRPPYPDLRFPDPANQSLALPDTLCNEERDEDDR